MRRVVVSLFALLAVAIGGFVACVQVGQNSWTEVLVWVCSVVAAFAIIMLVSALLATLEP